MYSKLFLIAFLSIVEFGATAPTYFNKRLEEAEQIALEATGLLLPIDSVVGRIMRDLKAIRETYPEVQKVVHTKKWVPGEVLIRSSISDYEIEQIDESRLFGPLQNVRKTRSGSTALVFTKPYNPEMLAKRLKEKFGVRAEPNTIVGDGFSANGSISYNPTTGSITVEQRRNSAFAGFRSRSATEYMVRNGKVTILQSMKPGFQFSA